MKNQTQTQNFEGFNFTVDPAELIIDIEECEIIDENGNVIEDDNIEIKKLLRKYKWLED